MALVPRKMPVVWWHTLDTSDGDDARALWAALRLIRETVEKLAPPGAVPNDEHLGTEPMREAEAIIQGIHAIARAAPPST